MRRRKPLLIAAIVTLVSAGATFSLVSASGDSSSDPSAQTAASFKPSKLKGKWEGEHGTENFQGEIRGTVRVRDNRFIVDADFDSPVVFGCPNPPRQRYIFKRGTGNNKWNGKGFNVDKTTQTAGDINGRYVFGKERLVLEGDNPRCLEEQGERGWSWDFRGKLTNDSLTGTVTVRPPRGRGEPFEQRVDVKKLP